MDLTGSIFDATSPLSTQVTGSVLGLTGSSFIDTVAFALTAAPGYLLGVLAGIGADLGSTTGA
ncbi:MULTISPECIES: hypothetical protein [Dietzia]|jgi:hypothetical protein|uniref:Uncharacterized protein n=1 Tax=Dietzia maris TaxID=37915 RepID=A0A365PDY0_9ACTN|nr:MULTISPECIES: hypothetical protein [Dietzia]OAV79577.1 hypothetical protein AYO52_01210 [Dietzia sp. 111N12-1]RBA39832.1 hypothetical protein DQ226_02830 [Dietzia maris]USX46563.1 hypothetical protein NHB83_03460 [Dietzia kunjamensis]